MQDIEQAKDIENQLKQAQQSPHYINTVDAVSKYLMEDFMLLLNTSLLSIVIDMLQDKEKFLDSLYTAWRKRAEITLSSEASKLHETLLTAGETIDDDKLKKELGDRVSEFLCIQKDALSKTSDAVNNLLKASLQLSVQKQKEREEENDH